MTPQYRAWSAVGGPQSRRLVTAPGEQAAVGELPCAVDPTGMALQDRARGAVGGPQSRRLVLAPS
jgi:hypothetical protein